MSLDVPIEDLAAEDVQIGWAMAWCCIEDLDIVDAGMLEYAREGVIAEKDEPMGRRYWRSREDALTDLLNEVWSGIDPETLPSDVQMHRLGLTREEIARMRTPDVMDAWRDRG